jgi:ubiquitin carboxyl-terminal hydrolase 40
VPDEYSKYELFSVIIHSGSAYGGHYHTYIKDVEYLGNWIIDEDENKSMKTNKDLINNRKEIMLIRENQGDEDIDYLKYENPIELIKAFIFNNHAYNQVRVDTISSDLTKHGMSWNKLYKPKYGTIIKFLKKNDDVFELTQDEKLVNLKANFKIHDILSSNYESFKNDQDKKQKELEELEVALNNEEQELEQNLDNLHLNSWFDFNDEKIQAIKPSLIEKQFAGKESAYMLFYRRKNQELKQNFAEKDTKKVPNWLIEEIRQKNEAIRTQRQIYDKNIYELNVKFYLDINFFVSHPNKVLKTQNEASFISIKLDKRDKISDLKEKLVTYCTSIENNELNETILNYILSSDNLKYLLCKQNPHEYYYISKILDENETLSNFQQNCSIILSNNSDSFCIGDSYEPIKLIIKYYYDDETINYKKFNEFSELFTKQTTIKEIKDQLADVSCNNKKQIKLVSIEKNKKTILNRQFGIDTKRLSEFEIKNNDYLIIENDGDNDDEMIKTSEKSLKNKDSIDKEQITIEIVNFIENSTSDDLADALKYTQIELMVNKSDHVNSVKILAISAFSLDSISYDECHLRYINSGNIAQTDLINEFKSNNRKRIFNGSRLYENDVIEKVVDLNVSNLFVLCYGRAPLENEFNLKCCCLLDNGDSIGQNLIDDVKCEILVNKSLTVDELVKKIIEELNLSLNESDIVNNQVYYLKKVNWMGDPDAILNSLTKTLNDVNLTNNSYVCITKGFLVPQNHVKINIWLHELNNTNEDEIISKKLLNCDVDLINDEFKYVNCIICKYDLKLEELKVKIGESLNKNLNIELDLNEDIMRIRLMKKIIIKNSLNKKVFIEKYQLKKPLFNWHKTLKQINLSNEVDLCVQLIETGGLNQGIVLLGCMRLDLKTNTYANYKEISWNINNGANLSSIKQTIIKEYNLDSNDVYCISIAKRLVDKYDWILIKDTTITNTDDSKVDQVVSKTKGRKPKASIQQQQSAKSNLKNSPYYLDDGDLIGFVLLKDEDTLKITSLQTISNKEFMTKFDLDYKANQIDLNKLKKKKAGGKDALDMDSKGTRKNRRAEVGIVIKTDDFN